MKILVTGFDPFGGEKLNPAFEAVKLLPDVIAGAEVIKQDIPTVFAKCGEVLNAAMAKYKPDAVLCVGQAGGRSSISVEQVAINLAEARIPDNEKNQPRGVALEEDGATAYFASLPVKAMVKAIQAQGIPSSISYTAGTFVCNAIMYKLLYMIECYYKHVRGGFIHVPFDTAQVIDKPVGMPIAAVAKGLEYAVAAIVLNDKDIDAAAGQTH